MNPSVSLQTARHRVESAPAITWNERPRSVECALLRDAKMAPELGGSIVGPLHLIACQVGVTESQARQILGFPDATVVAAPFGIFVADEIQLIQFALLRDCRDETTTRDALRRFLSWIAESGEAETLVERATGRRNIIKVLASEAKRRTKSTN